MVVKFDIQRVKNQTCHTKDYTYGTVIKKRTKRKSALLFCLLSSLIVVVLLQLTCHCCEKKLNCSEFIGS